LGPSLDGLDVNYASSRNRESVTIRRTRQTSKKNTENSNPTSLSQQDRTPEAALPGIGTVWLKTWGCSHNVSDSEYMAGQLAVHGFEVTEDESKREDADLWLLNSCTVKDPSQAAFVNLLRAGRDRVDKKTGLPKPAPLVLAGCVPQAERNLKSLNGLGDGVSLVGVAQLERIVEVVERTMRGECVRALSKRTTQGNNLPSLKLPKIRRNPMVEIVPLSTGCLGACTYCKTVHARGKLGSYPLEDILQRVRYDIIEGVTEIW
jgi:threonylcarbamoyladenosine tRNA methylthiotransferase CDKAL1